MRDDPWEPTTEPARAIYFAFQREAKKRPGRTVKQWLAAELEVVWAVARDYAQQHGMQVLTLKEIQSAEQSACAHIDYGAKWAYGVARRLAHPDSKDGGAND